MRTHRFEKIRLGRAGRALTAAISSLACCLALTACGFGSSVAEKEGQPSSPSSSSPSSSSSSERSNQEVTNMIRAYDTKPTDPLTPGQAEDSSSTRIVDLIFSGLVTTDGTGKWTYDAAKDIEPNEDYTAFTVTLKSDLGFSNGTEVTSSSFTRAWSYEANIANKQPNAGYLSLIQGYADLRKKGVSETKQLSGLTILDDQTFVIELSKPCLNFISLLSHRAFYPLPDSFYSNPQAFAKHPVGNGPYQFWERTASSITLVTHLNYKDVRKAKNDGIIFIFYTSSIKAYQDVQEGKLDLLETVPSQAYTSFMSDPLVKNTNASGSQVTMLVVGRKQKHFGLDDEGALRRQAISRALRRTAMISQAMPNLALPATDFLSPKVMAYTDSLSGGQVLTYSSVQARNLWQKANKIKAWSSKDVITISYDAQADNPQLYQAISRQLTKVLGVTVILHGWTTTTAMIQSLKKQTVNGFAAYTWRPNLLLAWDFLMPVFSTQTLDSPAINISGYNNQEFNVILSKAITATTGSSASNLYRSSEELLLQELPAIPLFYKNSFGVSSLTVRGFSLNWNGLPLYTQIRRIPQSS